MKKLIVFHPAIAPYRIDFFNSLNEHFDASFYFLYLDALEQSFDQEELISRLSFRPHYLKSGRLGMKNLRPEVFSILRREKPDVVFCSEYNLLGIMVMLYKKMYAPQLKVVTICDDNKEMAAGLSGKKKVVRDYLVKRFDGVILANPGVTEWYNKAYSDKHKFIYFPIIQEDHYFRNQLEKALPLTQEYAGKFSLKNRKVILYVGRLAEVKNLDLLLDAFHRLSASYPQAFLLIVGEGTEYERLHQKIYRQGDEQNILFLGKRQGADLYAIYNLAQLFVLPSIYEPFGAVVNEALLSGCYTLCSEIAGSSGLIEKGVNGELFNPASVQDLAGKLESIMPSCAPLEIMKVKENRMSRSYREYFTCFMREINHIIG